MCSRTCPKIDAVVAGILDILDERGVFVSESHYLLDLIDALQYDTVYHEHLRYYSLHSLKFLLEKHGLEIFHVKRILHARGLHPRLRRAEGTNPRGPVRLESAGNRTTGRPSRPWDLPPLRRARDAEQNST